MGREATSVKIGTKKLHFGNGQLVFDFIYKIKRLFLNKNFVIVYSDIFVYGVFYIIIRLNFLLLKLKKKKVIYNHINIFFYKFE